MKKTFTAIALSLASLAALAAPTYVYDYTYNGTTSTTNATAAGNQLQNGQSVGLTVRAAGNDFFQVSNAWGLWMPLGMNECGTRIGDLTFMAKLDGLTVATGGYTAGNSYCVHVAQNLAMAVGLQFDELSWEFTQTSFSTDNGLNTLGSLFSEQYNGGGNPALGNTAVYIQGQAVPEPSSLMLLATAIGGLWARRRITKA